MSQPLISLRSIYLFDPTLFDDFSLPAALADMKDDIVVGILTECDELQLTWSNPKLVKSMIGSWSRRRQPNWERFLAAWNYHYEIGDNYNMRETYAQNAVYNGTSNQTYNSKTTDSTNNYKNGFNGNNQALASSQNNNGTSDGGQDTKTDHTEFSNYEKTRKGNTGVATYQDMVDKELEIALKYDLESLIIKEFRDYFCVVVY